MEETEETMDRDAGPVPPGSNVEELRPDAEESGSDEAVFPPGCEDIEGEEDGPKDDTDSPVLVALDAEETCPVEIDTQETCPVEIEAQETCPVENGSRVTVSVLLA